MSFSKENESGGDNRRKRSLLQKYQSLLVTNPVLTKSITSGVIAGTADLVSQFIAPKGDGGRISPRSVASFAAFGFCISGPLTHHFYKLLDQLVPKTAQYATVKRVLVDRLVLAPPYLLLFYYVVSILDGTGHSGAVARIKETYWATLKMNWRVWTLVQYVNINYVPQQFRVMFASIVAFFWSIFLAVKRR